MFKDANMPVFFTRIVYILFLTTLKQRILFLLGSKYTRDPFKE